MTAEDLQRIRASRVWREHRIEVFHGTSEGSVFVKGQRPSRDAWRHRLMTLLARLLGLPLLAGDPDAHGAAAQATEVARLRSLRLAGVAVPALLHVDDEFIVMECVAGRQLNELLRGDGAVAEWQRALRWITDLHAKNQYLSQAYARNFVVDGERLVAIDFESDPLRFMPLEAAQARDWLSFLFTSMSRLPTGADLAAALIGEQLRHEPESVQAQLRGAARRLSWVLRMRGQGSARSWRRYVSNLQAVVAAILETPAQGRT